MHLYIYIHIQIHSDTYTHTHTHIFFFLTQFLSEHLAVELAPEGTCSLTIFFHGWWQEKAKWEHTWGTWCNMQDWAFVLAKHDGTTSTEPCWQGPEHSLFAVELRAFSEKLESNNRKRRVGQREVEVVSAGTSGVSGSGTTPNSSHVSAVEKRSERDRMNKCFRWVQRSEWANIWLLGCDFLETDPCAMLDMVNKQQAEAAAPPADLHIQSIHSEQG